MPPSEDKENTDSSSCKFEIKPLTPENLFFYYVPLHGALSYTALSVHVLNPSLVVSIFQKRDITNALLASSVLGGGLYIYNSQHQQSASTHGRIGYSLFGSVMFNFGSVLLWAVLRSVVPEDAFLGSVCGVVSSFALIKAARSYVSFIDSQIGRKLGTQ